LALWGDDVRPWGGRSLTEQREIVFAAHRITIDAPYAVVSARLTHLLNWGVLRGVSQIAFDGGLESTARVGPLGATWGLSRLVRVRTLPPVRQPDRTTIGLRWEAAGVTGDLFPVLDAELTLTPDGQTRTRLELVGSYRPPLGRAGMTLDRAIMGRVAAATISSFLEQAGAVLADPSPQAQADHTPEPSWAPTISPDEG
jgi:hypothetical protein